VSGALGVLYAFGALRTLATRYDGLTPLALPGASFLRLPAADVEAYQRLTRRMQTFDAFVTQPGLDLSSPLAAYLERCPTTETIGDWQVRDCVGVTPAPRH